MPHLEIKYPPCWISHTFELFPRFALSLILSNIPIDIIPHFKETFLTEMRILLKYGGNSVKGYIILNGRVWMFVENKYNRDLENSVIAISVPNYHCRLFFRVNLIVDCLVFDLSYGLVYCFLLLYILFSVYSRIYLMKYLYICR